ncbi:MAG: permease, partial [Planctomycetota bacterium]
VHYVHRVRSAAIALDAFVIVMVGGLVLTEVLPLSIGLGGVGTLVACVVGFLLPTLAERGLRPASSGARSVFIVFALVALFAHATVDGIALTDPGGGHDHGHDHQPGLGPLPLAVILHRLPVGISIWWIVARTVGVRLAVTTLLVIVAGTFLGFGVGDAALEGASGQVVGIFGGLLSGSLLHVVMHAHIPAPAAKKGRYLHVASLVGMLLALVSLFGIPHDHAPGTGHVHASGETFVDLALQSAPALVLAYLAVGAAHVFMPMSWIQRITRGGRFTQALRGMVAGLPLPVCSCGIIPIYRFLIVRGSAVTAAVAFLIATPELEIAAILLTFQLMGTEIAVARVLAAAVLAIVVGVFIGALAPSAQTQEQAQLPDELADTPPAGNRFWSMLRFGYGDAVDNTAAWIVLGIGLSAMLAPHLTQEFFASLTPGIDVPLAALLGLPLYVCASGSTPLAAIMVFQGLSPGAAIAFLLTGPATNITTFGVLHRLHGRRVAVLFSVAMLVLAVGLGYLTNLVLMDPKLPALIGAHDHSTSWLRTTSLGILAAVFLFSVLRRGTRAFIEQIMEAPTAEHGDGQHGDHCA